MIMITPKCVLALCVRVTATFWQVGGIIIIMIIIITIIIIIYIYMCVCVCMLYKYIGYIDICVYVCRP